MSIFVGEETHQVCNHRKVRKTVRASWLFHNPHVVLLFHILKKPSAWCSGGPYNQKILTKIQFPSMWRSLVILPFTELQIPCPCPQLLYRLSHSLASFLKVVKWFQMNGSKSNALWRSIAISTRQPFQPFLWGLSKWCKLSSLPELANIQHQYTIHYSQAFCSL